MLCPHWVCPLKSLWFDTAICRGTKNSVKHRVEHDFAVVGSSRTLTPQSARLRLELSTGCSITEEPSPMIPKTDARKNTGSLTRRNQSWRYCRLMWYICGMSTKSISEIDIWTGVISPDRKDMSDSEANAILGWSFNDEAKTRMDELMSRNGRGELTDSEREELEAYNNVGQVIGILQAKARLSLKRSSGNGAV